MKGTITRLRDDKMYGFIKADEGDYFFHKEDFVGHWNDLVEDFGPEEIEVEFNPDRTPKGLRARQVKRLDYPNRAV